MKYDLKIQKSAQKSLVKINEPLQSKIIDKIYALADDPYHNTKKLIGREAYRIRVGNYRIIYEIHNNKLVVMIIAISHRRNIYNK